MIKETPGFHIFALVFTVGVCLHAGCKKSGESNTKSPHSQENDERDTRPKEKSASENEPSERGSNTENSNPDKNDISKSDGIDETGHTLHNLPLPSELKGSVPPSGRIRTAVKRPISAVERHLRNTLINYEIFRKENGRITAIPLQENMPRVTVEKLEHVVQVTYIIEPTENENDETSESKQASDGSSNPQTVPPGRVPNGTYSN